MRALSGLPGLPNYFLMTANLRATFREYSILRCILFIRTILPVDRPPRERANLCSALLIGLVNLPSSVTSESLLRKLALGILTLSNKMKPLSMPSRPAFLPQSPTVMPGRGRCYLRSLSGTINAWGPSFLPSMISCAKATHMLEVLPAPPIQNFMASLHGVLMINCCYSLS